MSTRYLALEATSFPLRGTAHDREWSRIVEELGAVACFTARVPEGEQWEQHYADLRKS